MRTGIKFSSGIKAVIVYYSWCPTSLPEGGALTYGMRRSGPFKSMRFAAYRHFEKVEKVTGKVSLSHHLLIFVISRPTSEAAICDTVPFSCREGAGSNDLSPPPSRIRYMQTCLRYVPRHPCPGNPSGRCRLSLPFSVTFRRWDLLFPKECEECGRKGRSATAANRGKWCRCGKG